MNFKLDWKTKNTNCLAQICQIYFYTSRHWKPREYLFTKLTTPSDHVSKRSGRYEPRIVNVHSTVFLFCLLIQNVKKRAVFFSRWFRVGDYVRETLFVRSFTAASCFDLHVDQSFTTLGAFRVDFFRYLNSLLTSQKRRGIFHLNGTVYPRFWFSLSAKFLTNCSTALSLAGHYHKFCKVLCS